MNKLKYIYESKMIKFNIKFLILSLIIALIILYEAITSGQDIFMNVIFSWKELLAVSTCFFLALTLVSYIIMVFVWRKLYKYKNRTIWFILICSIIFSIITLLITGSYYWKGYFHFYPIDTFMDYFNMLYLASYDDPYVNQANYPAMCFLLLKLMYRFLNPDDITVSSGSDGLRQNNVAMMGFYFVLALSLITIYYFCKGALDDRGDKNMALVLLFTGPLLFLVERGNLLIVTYALLLVYLNYYDSDSKRKRYIAYIALSISASIKLYPALFGILTLKRKNIKETVHLALLGIVAFVLPFFYFDGITTFKEWLGGMSEANEQLTSGGVGYTFSIYQVSQAVSYITGRTIHISSIGLLVLLVLICAMAILNKVQWETLFLIATACVWYPIFSFTYTLVLYVPALLSYLNQKEEKKHSFESISLVLIQALMILPNLRFVDNYINYGEVTRPLGISAIIINIVIFGLFIKIIFNMLSRYLKTKNIIFTETRKIQITGSLIGIMVLTIVILGINRISGLEGVFDGRGTKYNPYLIQSSDDFLKLAEIVNGGNPVSGLYFKQTGDIEFDGGTSVEEPIGWSDKGCSFDGVYDGNGYAIKNYYSSSYNSDSISIFGEVNGEIRNLVIENCNINGWVVGGIAYSLGNNGKIVNCSINGLLNGYKTGGIVVYNYGAIENCVVFVTMDSTNPYGITDNESGEIINSYSNIASNIEKESVISDSTLNNLNSYVLTNNSNLLKEYTLYMWIVKDGYLEVVH